MFGMPFLVEALVWGYLVGVGLNLLVFETAAYQLSRSEGPPYFRDWTSRCQEIVLVVFWFPGWVLLSKRLGPDLPYYPGHLLGSAFGNRASMEWFIDRGHWKKPKR